MRADNANSPARDIVLQRPDDHLCVQVVEPGGGLVQEENSRFLDQRAGNRRPLLLSAREKLRAAARELLQAEQLQPVSCAYAGDGWGKAGQAAGQLQVALERGEREQVQLLEDEAELLSLEGRVGGRHPWRGDNASFLGDQISRQQAEQRRFAAARGAFDKADPGREGMIKVTDNPVRPSVVAKCHALAFQDGRVLHGP